METDTTFTVKSEIRIIDSYDMNQILKRDVLTDSDRVKLVDLWCEAHRIKRELDTLKRLVDAVKPPLPY
jgi:hypothetical protein